MLGGCGWVIFLLQPFGHRGRTFATIAATLALLLWALRTAGRRGRAPRFVRLSGRTVAGALTAWLGLIAWSSLSPGGSMPTPKSDPSAIRVLTWNILHGTEGGAPWSGSDWAVRRPALRSALEAARPDVFCVQEALPGQVAWLEAALPGHGRVGSGRDDGRSGGEHCAIYFERGRFEEVDGGTFWLEEPSDRPPDGSRIGPKRICTWVRLRDRRGGRHVRVYNTHLYLTERARSGAVRLLLSRIAAGDESDAVLIAGDFNAPPEVASRRMFDDAGFHPTAGRSGGDGDDPTYQFYGIRMRRLDAILAGRFWRVVGHRIVDVKPGNTFPSDHFGIMADLALDEIR